MPTHALTLTELPGVHAICRLAPDAPIPEWIGMSPLVSITRTADELSIVCADDNVPDGIPSERGWRALKLDGPLFFSLVGIVAALVGPLAAANVSVFVISTFDTDYLLVKDQALSHAIETLRRAGHRVNTAVDSA